MTTVRANLSNVIVNIEFSPLLCDWNSTQIRFFRMIEQALPAKFSSEPRDFGVVTGNTLGEVSVWYRFFGGPDAITLFSNRLCMEFMNISPQNSDLVRQIMHDVETNFVSHFPECSYSALEVIFADHLQISDGSDSSVYMERYSIKDISKSFGDTAVLHEPSGRFSVRSASHSWSAECFVENSHRSDDDLFVHMRIRLQDVKAGDPFQDKADRILEVRSGCARALDLELVQ